MAMFGAKFDQDSTAPMQIAQPVDLSQLNNQLPRVAPAVHDPDAMPTWKAALGGLLDGIAQQTGGQATFIPEMMRRQQQKTAQQNALDQWRQEYDYKVSHPAPLQPTDQQRNFQAYQGMNPQTQQAFLRYQDAVNPRFTNTADGTSFVPRVGGPSQPAPSIPPKPDGMTNDQILTQAYAAARSGANVEDIFRRLQAWGVQP